MKGLARHWLYGYARVFRPRIDDEETSKLERGRSIWPSAAAGTVVITPNQLRYLLEGIDWRMPQNLASKLGGMSKPLAWRERI